VQNSSIAALFSAKRSLHPSCRIRRTYEGFMMRLALLTQLQKLAPAADTALSNDVQVLL
jgi:hypothetical protein